MPDIVPRNVWCAVPARGVPARIVTPTPRLWLHHGASGTSDVDTACSYARYHIRTHGWTDVGYSFLIADGKVLEGRGAGRVGAHTSGDNAQSHGICMVGSYGKRLPSSRDVDALIALVRHGTAEGWWKGPLTGGHRDAPGASTSCPGRRLWQHIGAINRQIVEEEDTMYVVKRGEQDARVVRAQKVLQAAGRAAGEGELLPRFGPDGDYGRETSEAVDRMASRAGLPLDGERGFDVLLLDYCRNWL